MRLFTRGKVYVWLLSYVPSFILVAWINFYINLELDNFLFSHIVSSLLIAYLFTFLFGDKLASRFTFTLPRVIFIIFISLVLFYLSLSLLELFGIYPTSLLVNLPQQNIGINPCPSGGFEVLCGTNSHNPVVVNVIYGFYLILSLITIGLSYRVACLIFKSDKKKKK